MEAARYIESCGEGGGVAPVPHGERGEFVDVSEFERVTAERDALQQLLNARDEEVGELRGLLHSLDCAWNSHDGRRDRFGVLMIKVEALASMQKMEKQA